MTGSGGFFSPGRMAIDSDDNLFAVERNRKRIVAYDSYDNYLGEIKSKEFEDPEGIWTDRQGLLYLVDRKPNSVSVLSRSGRDLYTFGSTGTGDYQFRRAHSVCANDEGWLFVSDFDGNRVLVFRPSRP